MDTGAGKVPRVPPLLAFLLMATACSADRVAPTGPDVSAGPTFSAADPGIAPPVSSPLGKSYGAWAARWWQWALENPASVNPVIDPTGENCSAGQAGRIWFLAGAFTSDPVTRGCTVPPGRSLFLPLINIAYFAFLNDPPETRTEEFVRSQVTCVEDAQFPLVEIDGVPLRNPGRYAEKSNLFDVILPQDNIFGATEADIPELTLSPTVDEGFYLFLTPRAPGQHTIRWQASSAACGISQDITYHLTVK